MLMLKAILLSVISIVIGVYSILGYQYQVEGYGLHPLICFAICFCMTVASIYLASIPHQLQRKARPKG